MAIGNLFNEEWYLKNNPDVKAAVDAGLVDAWTHYQLYGRFEGRAPSHLFDPEHYLASNPDVKAAVDAGLVTAYDHFMLHGLSEGRSFVPYFDVDFYLQNNSDINAAVGGDIGAAVTHFLLHGQTEIRPLSPFFDLKAYLDANPDVREAVEEHGANPLQHLVTHGFAEGRPLGNGISLAQFANDPTFQDAANPLAALARVAEVAPFLPTFDPPAGWEAPEDTPIPVDFVPVQGENLVVPPSVKVPDDVELPDTFEPVDPGPGPSPDPDPDPGPGPGPGTFTAKIIGAAIKGSGPDGTIDAGDALIIVFNQAVKLANNPFTAESAAHLGTDYEIIPLHPVGGVAQQYQIVLGEDHGFSREDEQLTLTLKRGAISDNQNRSAQSNVEVPVSLDGTLELTQLVGDTAPGGEWFRLAADVDYEFANGFKGNAVRLASLDGEPAKLQYVIGGDGDDVFRADSSDALRGGVKSGDVPEAGLVLDGGDGFDILRATLDKSIAHPTYAPTIRNIEYIRLTASTHTEDNDLGLMFTRVSGVQEIWNRDSTYNLTLTDVRENVFIGAQGVGSPLVGGLDYAVRYGEALGVDNIQKLVLIDSDINLFTNYKIGL